MFRAAMILIAVLCAAAVTPLAGQQAPDSARVAGTILARTSSPRTTPPGPRLSPRFQRFEPRLARSKASGGSSLAVEGGQHTLVIAALVVVLCAIIIVASHRG